MSVQEHKALAERLVEEALNRGNLNITDELFTDDFVDHQGGLGPTGGRDAAKQFVTGLRTAFPDVQFEVTRLVAEGDFVVLHLVARATHSGDFQGIPPTGKSVEWAGIGILRFAEGKVAERWNVTDLAGLMQQISG